MNPGRMIFLRIMDYPVHKRIPTVRQAIFRQLQNQKLIVSGSVIKFKYSSRKPDYFMPTMANPAESDQVPEFCFSRRHRKPRTCPEDLYTVQRHSAAN